MRLALPIIIVIIFFAFVIWLIWAARRDERNKDRSAMMGDENYLALEQATNLLNRIIEQDDVFPALLTKHRNEAEEIIADFRKRQLRKGK